MVYSNKRLPLSELHALDFGRANTECTRGKHVRLINFFIYFLYVDRWSSISMSERNIYI